MCPIKAFVEHSKLYQVNGEEYIFVNQKVGEQKIILKKTDKLSAVLVLTAGEYLVDFHLDADAVLDLCVLVMGKKEKIVANISVYLEGVSAKANFYCVSLLDAGANVEINTGIFISQDAQHTEGHLLEENILLGHDILFKTIPILDVHTDDVRASHGAKTHKLNDDKLFYLQAKGVSLQEAKKLFLESYINKVFSKLAAHDPDMIELEKNKLLQTIIL